MIVGSISENRDLEKRISITPNLVKKNVSQGLEVLIEKDYSNNLGFSDKGKESCAYRRSWSMVVWNRKTA